MLGKLDMLANAVCSTQTSVTATRSKNDEGEMR